jgi:DNA polymerase-4
MPMTAALRLCPRAVVVAPHRAAYAEASAGVLRILRDVTPLVQPLSLDEAFLDVAGAVRAQGRPAVIAGRIRERVAHELDLTCSVGVASTKFVAKVASARCKPDGMLVVPAADVTAFLYPLPVTALWGVGERTADALRRLGIRTIGDLAGTPSDTLRRAVGPSMGDHLLALASGIDPRPVRTDEVEKSISADHTVETDLTDPAEVRRELLRLSGEVAQRVRERGFAARTVGIKIRFADFTTVTRVRSLPTWTDATATMYDTAAQLYDALDLDRPRIRLVGVKCENLRPAGEVAEQMSFDDLRADDTASAVADPPASGSSASSAKSASDRAPSVNDRVLDAARHRFGADAIGFATLLRPPGTTLEPERLPASGDDR